MESNVSLIIVTIVLVLLIVILPIYNVFTRQDDMSYNIVLKAATNFVDSARTTGKISYYDYAKLIEQLDTTNNIYNIEIEVHKDYYQSLKADKSGIVQEYEKVDKIDYTYTILQKIGYLDSSISLSDSQMKIYDPNSTSDHIYTLDRGDSIFIRINNTNITKADSFLASIKLMDTSSRIDIDYGGTVLVNSILE